MKLDKFTVAKRYGKALFELADESKQAEYVHQELQKIREIFETTPDLGDLLSDARLNIHEKQAVMDTLLQGFTGLIRDSLSIIFEYDRMYDILLIIEEFEKRYNEQQNIAFGTVTSTMPLTSEQKIKLAHNMAQQLGYQTVELKENIDPTILGGIVVEMDHYVIDGSVKHRLEQLRKTFRNENNR